ncbi:MAG: hypothetical protein DWI06_03580 [Planctomycetota bacterium]|nr:MAG: hypothetical protein DWI06_03580 [Planctomycetota bacterium]
MSENSGSDRWKSLADDLGLPPEKPVSDAGVKSSGNAHHAGSKQDSLPDEDFLTFSKPVQRHSEPSRAPAVKTFPVPKVEPRHQPQETFANPDEILEVTFGSHRAQEQTQTNKVQIDRPMVDADESSTGNLQPETSGERSTEPDRGRGGRGRDQDRGGRGGRGRGRGREDNRNSNQNRNNPGTNTDNEGQARGSEVEMPPAKVQPAPVRNERAAPVTFGQGPDSRTANADDEILSGPESYGSHHPEQDGEIDEIDLSTWSVPSWEELIASLYKP